ncbi:hypothetical protein ACQ4LE_005807 [Meloidogyne hapla]
MSKIIFVFFILAFLTVASGKALKKRTAQDCKNIQDPYYIGICTKNGKIDYDCIYNKCHECCPKKHG